MKKIKFLLIPALLLSAFACQDYLELEQTGDTISVGNALQTQEDYEELLWSCYDVIANTYDGRMQVLFDLLSDDLAAPNANADYTEVYNRNMLFFNSTLGGVYGQPYFAIFRANSLIEALDNIPFSDPARKISMEAEAKFIRALGHFDLVRGWGQPYGFTANNSHPGIIYKTKTETEILPRNTVKEVYDLLISDLEFAEANLPSSNGDAATSWAAKALLAKIYFQMGDYALAAQYASDVIDNGPYSFDAASVDRFTPMPSVEAIFYTLSIDLDRRSGAFTGNYRSDGSSVPTLRASTEMYQTYGTDTIDARAAWFLIKDVGQPNEYYGVAKFNSDYFSVPVLHITDMKLMRAEAFAELGTNLAVAIQDVNDIRERAYAGPSMNLPSGSSGAEIIIAARWERRIEMLGEGDRVQQLKRIGAIQNLPITIRLAPWDCPGMILQFPVTERTDAFELNTTGGCN